MLYVFNGWSLYRSRTPEYPNSKCLLLATNYILTWNIMPSFIWIYAYNARIIILKWCSDREFQSHGFVGFFNAFCRIGDSDIHIFKKVWSYGRASTLDIGHDHDTCVCTLAHTHTVKCNIIRWIKETYNGISFSEGGTNLACYIS